MDHHGDGGVVGVTDNVSVVVVVLVLVVAKVYKCTSAARSLASLPGVSAWSIKLDKIIVDGEQLKYKTV